MQISNNYIVVDKVEDEKKDGFQTISVQDSSVYKGKVINLPEAPVCMGNRFVNLGDIVLFAKYSPDTHEIDLEDKKVKFVKISDILCVL